MKDRQPKFRIGQVVAYRSTDGKWEYDRIGSIRPAGRIYSYDSAWLVMNTARIELKYLRPLTKRECGRVHP
jgi:hypothetical protein